MSGADAGAAAWRVAAASVQGSGHVRTGTPCQDSHAVAVTPRGTLVAVVSDGAGSAPHSDAGSRAAADAALAFVLDAEGSAAPPADADGWRAVLREALDAGRRGLLEAAALRAADPRELAATLIVAVATDALSAAAQVGDGATVVETAEGELVALTRPDRGEYANETVFLVSPRAVETAQVVAREGAAARVGVLSDGLQNLALLMATGAPHRPFFDPLLRFAETAESRAAADERLAHFLGSRKVGERTDDDVTLVLAVRASA